MDDFINGILDALGNLVADLEAALVYIFNLIIAIAQYLYNGIITVANFMLQVFQDIGKFFVHLWDNFFKGIFSAILKGVVTFGKWLKNIFGPVVKFLRTVSKYIDRIYNRYVRPILRIIRIARVFLNLLRQLGFKWAAALDTILGKVQADIQRGFLLIKQYLNVAIDLLNILADPTNLLRRPTTLLSLRRIWHAFIRQYTGLPPGFFFPSPSKLAPSGLGFVPANFDRNDPLQNPPPSYYLAFDAGVPSFDFLGPGDTIADDAIDGVGAEDFFASDYGLGLDCDDPDSCMQQAVKAVAGGA